MTDQKKVAGERLAHNGRLTHGGDWAGFEIEYGKAPLDFSMNVNPLGICPQVQQAIAKAGESADRYPDPLCRTLTQRLALHEQVPPEWIFCGNGAADVIFRLAQALKPEGKSEEKSERAKVCREGKRPVLLITAPTFSEYETAFAEYGWEIRRFLLKEEQGFRISDDSFLQTIDDDTDAVFLCEPNNPTGVTTDRQLLQKIWERCRQTGTVLVIDECFNGFLEEPGAHSMKDCLEPTSGCGVLIILKAFTKLYGMAGVRLGYCLCADERIMGKIRRAGPPWNVSSLAQAAGIAALDAKEHVAKGVQIVHAQRPWLVEQLRQIGIERVYGEANYLLFYCSAELDEQLREHGILIRNCDNYPGLGQGWYRIAVRTQAENEQLIEALRVAVGC